LLKNKAIFFDRDGVINIPIIKKDKPYPPKEFKDLVLYKQVSKSVLKIRKHGFKVIVITNQPDYQRGLIKKKEILRINNYIKKKFKLDKLYVCYDSDDKSFFKKPNPGMILRAKKEFNLDLKNSFVIGDTIRDVIAGKKTGCKTFLIKKKYNLSYKNIANYYVVDLYSAINKIIKTVYER
jgi:D-glycero-D-manno-heptose 1,7-bisphosphate phosphatase